VNIKSIEKDSIGSANTVVIMELHSSTVEIEVKWSQMVNGELIMSHGSSNSRGVAIIFGGKLEYKIRNKAVDSNGRYVIVLCEIQGTPFLLINTYAPNDESGQVNLSMEIVQQINHFDIADETYLVWGGDFNLIFDTDLEAIGGNPSLKIKAIETLNEILSELNLCDIWRIRNPYTKRYTWRGCAQGKQTKADDMLRRRLDYLFISDELQPFVEKCDIIAAPSTDHSAILFDIKFFSEGKQGPSFWKFNNSLVNDVKYIQQIKEKIKGVKTALTNENINCPCIRWELIKYEIRKFTMGYSKTRAKEFRCAYQDLEFKIKQIENIDGWVNDKDKVAEHDRLLKELDVKSNYITEGLILRSKATWTEHGEKSTKYFLTLEKRNKKKTHVRKLILDDDVNIIEQKRILKEIERFYAELYKSNNKKSAEECTDFLSKLTSPKITEIEKLSCEGPLTMNECYKCLNQLGASKTPGNDGLTKEFYAAVWDTLGHDMVSCLNQSYIKGSLTTTQKQAVITLLEKPNKDNRYLDNWRPISLINVDAKICSKALSNRIINLLPNIIHQDQSAFVKGRNIEEPIRLIEDILNYAKDKDLSLILFAADFEKAFDSIDRNFIYAVLKHFGFGPKFIDWIRVLFCDNQTCVLNNGQVTNFFDIQRGTKQGDPISPYLFILVIEIMASMIRQNEKIQGISLIAIQKRITLFADDTTFFLRDMNSLEEVLCLLNVFYQFSSLKINTSKSEACWIGRENKNNITNKSLKWVNLYQEGIKILGIYFSYNDAWYYTNNFQRIFEQFKSILKIWKLRNLTLYGRIQVVRSLAMSKLLFVCSKIFVSDSFMENVKKEIITFIWNGKKAKIKYDTLIGDYNVGGMKLPDFENCIKANRIKWAINLLDSEVKSWKLIPWQQLDAIGGIKAIGINFDAGRIPKTISKFYGSILRCWAVYTKQKQESITQAADVLVQPLWNNSYILTGKTPCFFHQLAANGIYHIKDICNKSLVYDWTMIKEKGVKEDHFFYWISLTKAIPSKWKTLLKEGTKKETDKIDNKGDNINFKRKKSKDVYKDLINEKFKKPTAQSNIQKRISTCEIDWEKVYSRIYSTTIDTYTRFFQYKILNNCLYLNYDLFRFKLVDSPRCSYCHTFFETIDHLFVDCIESKNFYFGIRYWLSKFTIVLPQCNIENIILGVTPDQNIVMVNQILYSYKLLLYKFRPAGHVPTLELFINHLRSLETIEYKIASSNDRVSYHLKKWQNLLVALRK